MFYRKWSRFGRVLGVAARRILALINIGLGITMILLPLANYAAALPQMKEKIELQPPSIKKKLWNWNTTTQQLTFRFDISELGDKKYKVDKKEIASRIMDFGIIIIKKDPNGDPETAVNPHGTDPLTEEDYKIPISFTALINSPATTTDRWRASWGGMDGSYTVSGGSVGGSGWLVRTDNRHAYINGTIKFGDWEPGRYYVVVWAVDEWGNARWICYEVNSDSKVSIRKIMTTNYPGNFDPIWWDLENHYYTTSRPITYDGPEANDTTNASVFTPYYIVTGIPPVPGLQLSLPAEATIEMGGVSIRVDDSRWGFYTRRIEWLESVGEASISGVVFHFYGEPIFFVRCWLYLDLILIPIFLAWAYSTQWIFDEFGVLNRRNS